METKKKSLTRTKSNVRKEGPPQLTRLTKAEAKRLARPHVGFEAFVEPLAELMSKFGAELGTSGIDVESMRESLRAYRALQPMYAAAEEHRRLVGNTRLAKSSHVWEQMMLIYARALISARTNREIAAAIDAFVQFMKKTPHAKRVETAPATT